MFAPGHHYQGKLPACHAVDYEPKSLPGKGVVGSGEWRLTEADCTPSFEPRPRDMRPREFINRFGSVYEDSPWIAEAVYRQGLTPNEDSPAGLASAMAAVVALASRDAKLALIRAHPDLAGRAAIAGDLTEASKSEQSGAGLDRCTPEEYRRFQDLNEAYKARFGFPFILAVSGKTRHDILTAFEARLGNVRETELRTALEQIDRIARLRLEALARQTF
jgi:2-oxo-4-hydroxy-4-carboxy-5-ureidoimidazoline decarboxylase